MKRDQSHTLILKRSKRNACETIIWNRLQIHFTQWQVYHGDHMLDYSYLYFDNLAYCAQILNLKLKRPAFRIELFFSLFIEAQADFFSFMNNHKQPAACTEWI